MSYCTECGKFVKEGHKFCSNCGTKIIKNPMEETDPIVKAVLEPFEYFDLDNHLQKLRSNGIMKSKADKLETKKWDSKEYLNEIFQSLTGGGFSYFKYKGEAYETEFTEGIILQSKHHVKVRDKEPILMKDETLEKIADIMKGSPDNSLQLWGPLYYTGRRFIMDTVKFQAQAWQGQEVEFSLPLSSYWIKPDYSDLFNAVNADFFFEDGIFRKKKYDRLSFKVIEVKKPTILGEKGVQCGYLLDGPDGEYLYDNHHFLYNMNDEPIDEFAGKIRDLINRAKVTKVSDLIKHTYECQLIDGASIETSLHYGSRMLRDKPYSFTGYWTKFV